jgi:hypothetical protein
MGLQRLACIVLLSKPAALHLIPAANRCPDPSWATGASIEHGLAIVYLSCLHHEAEVLVVQGELLLKRQQSST